MLSFQLLGLNFLFYSSVGLSVDWLTLNCPLSEFCLHPFCLTDACYVCQLVESLKFMSGTLLTFPCSLSPSLSPFLLSSLLPVAAAERLYSQLERNRLLSNELKRTLHDLCDWWQGSLMPIKLSLLLTPLTWTPAKKADCLFKSY